MGCATWLLIDIHCDAEALERVNGQVDTDLACHRCECRAQGDHILIGLNFALPCSDSRD